ncbi:MAG: cytochrome c [Candidatus Hydrothermarchaeaceae archaeon]
MVKMKTSHLVYLLVAIVFITAGCTQNGGPATTAPPVKTEAPTTQPPATTTAPPATTEAPASVPVGNIDAGKEVFSGKTCSVCHFIKGDYEVGSPLIAPELSDIGARKDAAFIKESILDPNAVVAEGYTLGMMPQNFGDQLSEVELNDIVAYLSSLKG